MFAGKSACVHLTAYRRGFGLSDFPTVLRQYPEDQGIVMTKAQHILKLYGKALGTMPTRKIPKFVAAKVGTTHGYVRTVARQRLGRGICEAERRYLASPLGKKMAAASKNRWRAKRRAEARA